LHQVKARDIPFVTHSGLGQQEGVCAEGIHVDKPASPTVLVTTIKALLASRPISN
jgi:hypothetical protein